MRQVKKNSRGRWGALAFCGAMLLGTSGAQAALVTINNCVGDPHIQVGPGGSVLIDVGADDLSLRCAITPPSPSAVITIRGQNITIENDIIFPGRPSGESIVIDAKGTLTVGAATIESTNPNSSMRLVSVGDMEFKGANLRTGVDNHFGYDMRILCTGPGCKITARQTNFTTRRFSMLANGDIYWGLVKLLTNGPRDRIDIVSTGGSALMYGCGNVIRGGAEAKMLLKVCQQIDLAFAKVDIGRDIDILTTGGCGRLTDIRMTGMTLRNDFGKTGDITITAAGQQNVDICEATIVDDDGDVSEINGREQVPHTGFNNVTGTPDVDD